MHSDGRSGFSARIVQMVLMVEKLELKHSFIGALRLPLPPSTAHIHLTSQTCSVRPLRRDIKDSGLT
jgi:hypothetical protein